MTHPEHGASRAPLPPIQFEALAAALAAQADTLVPQWLPGGDRHGPEYVCADFSGGKGRSCSVRVSGDRAGAWADFASGEQGRDLISLYARIHSLSNARAAVQVARDYGLEQVAGVLPDRAHQRPPLPPAPPKPPAPAREPEGWTTVRPVPAGMPAPTFRHQHRPEADIVQRSAYRCGGDLHGYVVRFRTSVGGKEDLPYTFCKSARDGAMRWHWKQFDAPRPLYLADGQLPAGRTVVLCEGEPKSLLLQGLLDAGAPGVYAVVSWPGGCKAWAKADWSWLAGCTVLAWPDADSKREQLGAAERKALADDTQALAAAKAAKPYLPQDKQPGWAAMLGIGRMLVAEHGCAVQILPLPEPGTLPDGWDAGDAVKEGWTCERVLQYFGRAQPLPPDAGAPEAPGAKKIDGPGEPKPGGNGAAPPASGPGGCDGDGGGRPWWLRPYWDADKSRWLVSRKLVIAALRHDEALQGVLAFNQLTNNLDARRAWPFVNGQAGPVRNSTDLLLGSYLSDTYGLPSIARAALAEGMEAVAFAEPYHPVREYLDGLQWDGKPRLNKWLMHVIGETPETVSAKLAEYLSLVGRFFVMGLVARVLDPGCKFDYCLVLEGKGGRYKSTALKTLVGKAWFSDTRFDVQKNKEAQEQVQGVWLYELGELAHFNKAGVDEIKAFVSSEVDRYRPAYGRHVESFPRQCVLAATTNNRKYLRDKTGNRRFWPVPVNHVMNLAWIARWRDQLFAEALQAVRAGEPHWPDQETEERLFVPMQQERLVVDAVEEELMRVLTRSPVASGIGAEVNELTEHVSVAQLVQALNVDVGKANAGLQSQIRGWLEQEGWEQKKVTVGTTRLMRYMRPAVWPRPDEDEGDAPMEAPPAGQAGAAADEPMHGDADDAPF